MSSSVELDAVLAERADWRAAPERADSLQPVTITGRYQYARRCIDPPCLDLSPVTGATHYELLVAPLDALSTVYSLRFPEPRISLAPVWPRLPVGRLQLAPRAWTGDRLIGVGPLTTLIRSPDWDGQPRAPLDYQAAGLGVIDYLARRAPAATAHPEMPAYMWHAATVAAGDEPAHDFQFPALSYPSIIGLFITGAASGGTATPAAELLTRARQLADFLIAHPSAASGPLAGVPLSTMNQAGTGGMFEENRITLVRIGWTGCAMLSLAEATGESRYTAYAERLGRILLDTQQADGSWPYRVRVSDGAVLEPYTAAAVMALLLLERLEATSPNGAYTEALDRGLAWTLANPVQTGLWQQMYEDVPTLEPYVNLEQWAAIETAMLLLRRQHPDALDVATALVRYVEDQFVVFGDDPIFPIPYLPFTPAALEQYHCYWPMDVHTANYARAALALYQASGEIDWAHKAIAAANTVVRCQGPDGRFSTLVPDRRLGVTPPFTVWFNCMAHAADVLLRIGPTLTAIAREEGGDDDTASMTDPLRAKGARG